MERNRINNLVKALQEAKPEDFRMDAYVNRCGTPACVLGHYAARRDLQDVLYIDKWAPRCVQGDDVAEFDSKFIRDHFGLTYSQAGELFGEEGCGGASTPQEAIQYIKKFLKEHAE